MLIKVLVLVIFSLFLSVRGQEEQTPAPPIMGDFGGLKSEQRALSAKYLETTTSDQKDVFNDESPLLKEVRAAFNKTLITLVQGYAFHKSMLVSDDKNCDRKAEHIADETINEARDASIECLADFRRKIRSQVKSDVKNIGEIESELLKELIIPVDDCYENLKLDTMKKFGQNIADHLICAKKLNQK